MDLDQFQDWHKRHHRRRSLDLDLVAVLVIVSSCVGVLAFLLWGYA